MGMAMKVVLESLQSAKPNEVAEIMREEGALWSSRLRWDYDSTHEFISNYMGMRLLPGLVLRVDGEPLGYGYMVQDGNRVIFGNVYVLQRAWGQGYEESLAEGMIDVSQGSKEVNRIEAQMMIFSDASPEHVFEEAGFGVYKRNFLSLDMAGWNAPRPVSEGFRLVPWKDAMIAEAARVVYQSYEGSVDAEFATSFSRADKCHEFIYNLVKRTGCGDFLDRMTTVAVDAEGKMAGVVLSTRLSHRSGHLPQISVLPGHHGHGIGAWLVAESLSRFKKAGYETVSLTVTERNTKADAWYRRIGFAQVLGFNAYMWQR